MMKFTFLFLYIHLACIVLFTSCSEDSTTAKLAQGELYGSWRLDSLVSYEGPRTQYILISKERAYRVSYQTNDYIIDSAQLNNNQLIWSEFPDYKLSQVDSNRFCITSDKSQLFFSKQRRLDVNGSIKNFILGQRNKQKFIGKWTQLNNTRYPFKLLNYSEDCDSVSFEILEGGQAIFYLNKDMNRPINYSYRVDSTGIKFSKGCLSDDYDWNWNSDSSTVGLNFENYSPDTAWFKKTTDNITYTPLLKSRSE